MAAAIGLRSDFNGNDLRRLARASKDGRQVRRLVALAAARAARLPGLAVSGSRSWAIGSCGSTPAVRTL